MSQRRIALRISHMLLSRATPRILLIEVIIIQIVTKNLEKHGLLHLRLHLRESGIELGVLHIMLPIALPTGSPGAKAPTEALLPLHILLGHSGGTVTILYGMRLTMDP